jgi:hypothetical protein
MGVEKAGGKANKIENDVYPTPVIPIFLTSFGKENVDRLWKES